MRLVLFVAELVELPGGQLLRASGDDPIDVDGGVEKIGFGLGPILVDPDVVEGQLFDDCFPDVDVSSLKFGLRSS